MSAAPGRTQREFAREELEVDRRLRREGRP